MRTRRFLWAALAAAVLVNGAGRAGEHFGHRLDEASYDKYRRLILPGKEDLRWQEIPWRLGYWKGLVDAQKEDKPLLLWMYGGSPAGVC